MHSMTITNAKAVIEGKVKACNIHLVDGKIQGILPAGEAHGQSFDAKNRLVLPGFIDVHTHGAAGVDFNNASAEQIRDVRDFFATQGTTCFYPTLCADAEPVLTKAAAAVAEAKNQLDCHQILGIHLEGPFLNKKHKGAMLEETLINPDYDFYKRIQDASGNLVRRMTLSPELSGAISLISKLKTEGVNVSMGHSASSYEQTMEAVQTGASCATHLFNAMLPLEHHHPGIIGASFASDIYCEAIFDGKHLHPGTVCMITRSKGLERTVGITDSMMAAGLGDGLYKLASNDVVVKGLDAKLLVDGTRAGSVLTTCTALKNLMEFTGLPVEDAVRCLTATPAKMMGIYNRKGSIDVGKDADFVVLDQDMAVRATFSCGEIIYQA